MNDINTFSTEQLEQELAKRKEASDRQVKLASALSIAAVTILDSQVKTVVKVRHYSLERFINKVFNVTFDFVAAEEMSNDSEKMFEFVGYGNSVFRNSDDDNKNIEDFLFGRKPQLDNWTTKPLLEWLVMNKFIPAGDYMISVSW